MQWSGMTLLHYCRLQDTIALSTGEAELKSVCKGVCEALGLREVVEFLLNRPVGLLHGTDATAAWGILKRRGAGSLKHLCVRQLWCQEVFKRPATKSVKVDRFWNPSDLLCSIAKGPSMRRHLANMGCERI